MNINFFKKIESSKVYGLIKKNIRYELVFLIILSLAVRLSYFVYNITGGRTLPWAYDSDWYLERSYSLLNNFNIQMHFNDIMYLSYILTLTIMIFIFKKTTIIILIQVIVNALCVIFVYLTAKDIFNRKTAVFAGLLYCITWPVIYWSIYVLTDSIFTSLLILSMWLMHRAVRKPCKKNIILLLIVLIYVSFLRPNGLLAIFMMLLYIPISIKPSAIKSFLKRNLKIAIAFSAITTIALAIIIYSNVFFPLYQSVRFFIVWILFNIYANGQVFDIATPHDYKYSVEINNNFFGTRSLSFIFNNWYDILILYYNRTFMFFAFEVYGHIIHIIYKALVYFFSPIGLIALILNKKIKESSIFLLPAFAVFSFNIIIFIDAALRYKMPFWLFLNFLAAFGLDRTISLFCRLINKHTCKESMDASL